MKILFRTRVLCALILVCSAVGSAQNSGGQNAGKSSPAASGLGSAAKAAAKPFLGAAGKAAVIVIKSAAKMTWATTKIVGKDLLKPMAAEVMKPLIVKGTPLVAKFMLKATMLALKKGLPAALKLALL